MGIISRIFGNEYLRDMPKYCRYCGSSLECNGLSSRYDIYNGKIIIDFIHLECSSCDEYDVKFVPEIIRHVDYNWSTHYNWKVNRIEEAKEEIRRNLP